MIATARMGGGGGRGGVRESGSVRMPVLGRPWWSPGLASAAAAALTRRLQQKQQRQQGQGRGTVASAAVAAAAAVTSLGGSTVTVVLGRQDQGGRPEESVVGHMEGRMRGGMDVRRRGIGGQPRNGYLRGRGDVEGGGRADGEEGRWE